MAPMPARSASRARSRSLKRRTSTSGALCTCRSIASSRKSGKTFMSGSTLEEEGLFHSSRAQAVHMAVEIDRGIAVVGPNLQLVAYLRGKIRIDDIDDGMLCVQPAQTRSLGILQHRKSPLAADLLQADVENQALIAAPADHGSQHAERQFKVGAYGLVVGIPQHVRSSLDLGDPRKPAGNGMGSSSAGADNFQRNAVRADQVGRVNQFAHRLVDSLDLVRPGLQAHAMPFITDQAAQA